MQIRIGGAKGVLTIPSNPDIFKKEDGGEYKVLLRKS